MSQPVAKMEVFVGRDGNVVVRAGGPPLSDRLFWYGVLAQAADAVRNYDPARVEPAPEGVPLLGPKVG